MSPEPVDESDSMLPATAGLWAWYVMAVACLVALMWGL